MRGPLLMVGRLLGAARLAEISLAARPLRPQSQPPASMPIRCHGRPPLDGNFILRARCAIPIRARISRTPEQRKEVPVVVLLARSLAQSKVRAPKFVLRIQRASFLRAHLARVLAAGLASGGLPLRPIHCIHRCGGGDGGHEGAEEGAKSARDYERASERTSLAWFRPMQMEGPDLAHR